MAKSKIRRQKAVLTSSPVSSEASGSRVGNGGGSGANYKNE